MVTKFYFEPFQAEIEQEQKTSKTIISEKAKIGLSDDFPPISTPP